MAQLLYLILFLSAVPPRKTGSVAVPLPPGFSVDLWPVTCPQHCWITSIEDRNLDTVKYEWI